MRGKPKEEVFDVVQSRNPSGGSKPGNARVKGSVVVALESLLTSLSMHFLIYKMELKKIK